jgi:hypothetical protein
MPRGQGPSFPATSGDFFLALEKGGKGGGLAVYLLGNEQALWKDLNFNHGIGAEPWKRIFFIPQARVIVLFPGSNDRLELRRFDVEALLEKSGNDYLLITTQPPLTAKRGAVYTYQMMAKSRKADVRYKLDSGPEGMDVSAKGLLEWRVPLDIRDDTRDVIIRIRDAAGQEAFHTFTIRLIDG